MGKGSICFFVQYHLKAFHFRHLSNLLLQKRIFCFDLIMKLCLYAHTIFNDTLIKNELLIILTITSLYPYNPKTYFSLFSFRQATTEEQIATVKLQKQWKGYWVRKIRAARTPGSEENLKVVQNLQKCWAVMEPNLDISNPDHPGLYLFR